MEILRTILTVIYVIDCIALTVVVLMQEGKQQGLGAIAGISDTYWGRNKSRSAEGTLIRATKIMACLLYTSEHDSERGSRISQYIKTTGSK